MTLPGPPPSGRSRAPLLSNGGGGGSSSDALLIDLSPPSRSPSLAASGSDGVSVNSLGSESGGNEAFSSWATNGWPSKHATNTVDGFGGNFDPFASIQEESRTARSKPAVTSLSNGTGNLIDSSCSTFNNKLTSSIRGGPVYDSNTFTSQTSSGIDWSTRSSGSLQEQSRASSPPDPFSPIRTNALQPPPTQAQVQASAPAFHASQASTRGSVAAKSNFRATIIRPKQQQQPSVDVNSSANAARLKTIMQQYNNDSTPSTFSHSPHTPLSSSNTPSSSTNHHTPLTRSQDAVDSQSSHATNVSYLFRPRDVVSYTNVITDRKVY